MGCIGRELSLIGEGICESTQHIVEGVCQLFDFDGAVIDSDILLKILCLDVFNL